MSKEGSGQSAVGNGKRDRRGHANPHWKGGVSWNSDGYLKITAGPLRGVYVHRLVLEAKLGRPLRDDEEAHHIDGDRQNCRPENLEARPLHEHRAFLNGVPWAKQ